MVIWNPWHGCHKVSEGCAHCYMYFLDSKLKYKCEPNKIQWKRFSILS